MRRGAASNGQWDAITCNPADNIGPILSPHHEWTGWQHTIGDIVAGNDFPQTNAYRPWQVVDVRDCAAAHIALLESVTVRCTASPIVCRNRDALTALSPIKTNALGLEDDR